jgi:hypothetical protein
MPRLQLVTSLALAATLAGCTALLPSETASPAASVAPSPEPTVVQPTAAVHSSPSLALVSAPPTTTPTFQPPTATPSSTQIIPTPAPTPVAGDLDLSWLPDPPSPRDTIDWTQVEVNGLRDVGELDGIVEFNGRLILTGATGDPDEDTTSATWTSTNSPDWTAATINAPELGGGLTSPIPGGHGLLVTDRVAGILTSYDGVTWDPVADTDLAGWVVNDAVRAGSSFVAFGCKWPETNETMLWASTDGLEWTSVPQAEHIAHGLITATSLSDSALAFVADNNQWMEPHKIEVWRSTDGYAWSHVADLSGSDRAAGIAVAMSDSGLVAVSGHYLIMGDDEEALAWTSAGGTVWTKAPSAPWDLYALIPLGRGFVAAGGRFPTDGTGISYEEQVTGETWITPDGARWQRIRQPGSAREIDVLVALHQYVIAYGLDFNVRSLGTMWIAPAPDF